MPEPAFLTTTRTSFDAIAEPYAATFADDLAARPLDRALLAAFAETLPPGPVVDVGSGPGHVTAHLAGLGAEVSGVDLSPGMVEVARRSHPGVRFEVGSMLELDLADGALAGLLSYYSIVNLPRDLVPAAFAEFARVLRPGGRLLLGFLVGDTDRHGTEWFGAPIDLHVHRWQPDVVTELLRGAGLDVRATLVREPDDDGVEIGPRAYLLAQRRG